MDSAAVEAEEPLVPEAAPAEAPADGDPPGAVAEEQEKDPERTVFVAPLHNGEITETKLQTHFGQFGAVSKVTVMYDKATGNSKGYGFVTYVEPATCAQVIAQGAHSIDGKQVEAKKYLGKGAQKGEGGRNPFIPEGEGGPLTLFCGGLPQEVGGPELQEYFGKYGTVTAAHVKNDMTTGKSRGFGFVTFDAEESVKKCLADSTNHILKGKWVDVKRYGGPNKGSEKGK